MINYKNKIQAYFRKKKKHKYIGFLYFLARNQKYYYKTYIFNGSFKLF